MWCRSGGGWLAVLAEPAEVEWLPEVSGGAAAVRSAYLDIAR
jgi:hypothetical protein